LRAVLRTVRHGVILVKWGCVSQEQLASVLETQDAIRTSSLALDTSVIAGRSTAT